MSGYDVAVWCSDMALTREDAASYYRNMERRWIRIAHSASFDAFFRELMTKYPNLGGDDDQLKYADDIPWWLLKTADDREDETTPRQPPPGGWKFSADDKSPWAATVTPSGCGVQLAISWSSEGDIDVGIRAMALKHGLVFYDPQDNKVFLPSRLASSTPRDPRPVLIMDIAGKRPKLDVRISLRGREILHEAMASRVAAHTRARSLAMENKLPSYEVNDSQTIAQEVAVPISLDDPALPEMARDIIKKARESGQSATAALYPSGAIELRITDEAGQTTVLTGVFGN